MKEIEFIIKDIPPSYNKYLGNNKSFRIYGREKKRWAWIVYAAAKGLVPEVPLEKVEVYIKVYFKDRLRHDLDNVGIKLIMDQVVKMGFIKDDNYKIVEKYIISGAYDKKDPRTEIIIKEI